ncbi:DUF2493 domain-containing protein [Mesorhizobium sp. 1M-11]|uniref:DUF2493 domain-containing protein n=1 Tax=Mesorhizobium sp. 1M-11 TaxID=1529006 RepID=UPI000A9FEF71|nr:DUF2493 domain-containing protein [Mesorhizobium sp. 1M-11]
MMRVLVCGGRDYTNRILVWRTLDGLQAIHGRLTIIQGGASGADQLARHWCYRKAHSVLMINEPADWRRRGRAAGPIRNQRMIDEHRPELVIAFPGGNGTADMVERAKAAGIPIQEIR